MTPRARVALGSEGGTRDDASAATPKPTPKPVSISVVIPVKDDAAFLSVCLAALAEQSIPLHEVIVVDNGSTDHSVEVATSAAVHVTVLHEPRPGIAAASETGYDHAQGDLIARIDADTVVPPRWAETVVASFEGRPGLDVVTGGGHFTDGPPLLRVPAAVAYLGAYFALAGLALGHPPVFGSNFAMRRRTWESIRGAVHATDDVHDDFDLSFHLGAGHRVRFVPGLGVGISMRPLFDGRGALRLRRGVHTVRLHWPEQLPWLRVARRISAMATRLTGTTRAVGSSRSGADA